MIFEYLIFNKMRAATMNNIQLSDGELSVGQLAEAVMRITGLRCTPAMIYNYEKQGLLPPPRRSSGGVRKFRHEDLALVIRIKQAQVEGLSLEEIKRGLEDGLLQSEELPAIEIPNDKKSAILNAASVVFLEKGYVGTTLNEIAREAGVSVSTVYQYFGSKENLFLALTDSLSFVQSLENIEAALKVGESGDINDLRQAMIGVANAFLYAPRTNVEVIRLFIIEVKRFPIIGNIYRERLVSPGQGRFAEFLRQQIERGLFRPVDVHLAAGAFFGMFLNDVINEYLFLDRDLQHMPTPEGVASMVEIFLCGMLLNPPV
jgi:AcrR family transcriptional regulator